MQFLQARVATVATLCLFNISMERDPFIDDLLIQTVIVHSYVPNNSKEPKGIHVFQSWFIWFFGKNVVFTCGILFYINNQKAM